MVEFFSPSAGEYCRHALYRGEEMADGSSNENGSATEDSQSKIENALGVIVAFLLRGAWKTGRRKLISLSVVGALAGGSALGFSVYDTAPQSPAGAAAPKTWIKFSNLPDSRIQRCDQYAGTATAASGDGVLLLTRGQNDADFYIVPRVARLEPDGTPGEDSSSIDATVGGASEGANQNSFEVYAVLVSASFVPFFNSLTSAGGDGVIDTQLPPHSAMASVSVQRNVGDAEAPCE